METQLVSREAIPREALLKLEALEHSPAYVIVEGPPNVEAVPGTTKEVRSGGVFTFGDGREYERIGGAF